jgi:hypothetical protein
MSKKQHTPDPQALQTIDPTALAGVSGGRSRTASGSSSSSTSTSGDDATLTALTGILDSLRDLARSRNNSGFGTNEMLLLMMMMGRNNQQPTVVTTGAPVSPWGYGRPWGY